MDSEKNNIEELNPAIEENNQVLENQEAMLQDEQISDNSLEEILETETTDVLTTDNNDLNIDLPIDNLLIKPLKSNKRILQGVVVSNKPNKTIIVKIVRQVAHPLYKKYYKRSKKIMAHDEKNECNVGDTVRVIESRPISKMKRWSLIEIIERAK